MTYYIQMYIKRLKLCSSGLDFIVMALVAQGVTVKGGWNWLCIEAQVTDVKCIRWKVSPDGWISPPFSRLQQFNFHPASSGFLLDFWRILIWPSCRTFFVCGGFVGAQGMPWLKGPGLIAGLEWSDWLSAFAFTMGLNTQEDTYGTGIDCIVPGTVTEWKDECTPVILWFERSTHLFC